MKDQREKPTVLTQPRTTRTLLVTLCLLALAMAGCGGKPSYDPYDREDTNTVTIPAKRGIEFKLWVREGDSFQYTWTSTASLKCEFHGEPENYPKSPYASYKNTTGTSDSGSRKAPFTGTHGWYWENAGSQSVTVTVKTDGIYDVVGETGQKH